MQRAVTDAVLKRLVEQSPGSFVVFHMNYIDIN